MKKYLFVILLVLAVAFCLGCKDNSNSNKETASSTSSGTVPSAQGAPGVPQGAVSGTPGMPPGVPQGAPRVPQGAPGVPQGAPGVPQGAPGVPQGAPGVPQGAPGVPRGAVSGAPGMPPGVPQGAPGVPGVPQGAVSGAPGMNNPYAVAAPAEEPKESENQKTLEALKPNANIKRDSAGEIRAYYDPDAKKNVKRTPLTELQSREVALAFIRANYYYFDTMSFEFRNEPGKFKGGYYHFKWIQIIRETKKTGNTIDISVNPKSGEVVSYKSTKNNWTD